VSVNSVGRFAVGTIAVTSDDSTPRANGSYSYLVCSKDDRHDHRSWRRSKDLSGGSPRWSGSR
jgi:hypothetical protein